MSTRISIIVPAYNEVNRVHLARSEFEDAINLGYLKPDEIQLLLVDDGSTDGTREMLKDQLTGLFSETIVLGTDENFGKGHAVRLGMRRASSPYSVYMDLDMAASPRALENLLPALSEGYVFSIGSRAHQQSEMVQSDKARRFLGKSYNRLARLITRIELLDTQCGFKGINTDMGRLLFHFCTTTRFAFDLELLLIAKELGLPIREVPVVWTDVPGSKVRIIKDSGIILKDLIRTSTRRSRPHIFGCVLEKNPQQNPEILKSELNSRGQATFCFIDKKGRQIALFPFLEQEPKKLLDSIGETSLDTSGILSVEYTIHQLANQLDFDS